MNAPRTDLRTSTAEGTAASLMVGLGENYLPAFVLALGAGQLACGMVSSVPILVGAVAQLLTPWIIRRVRSYRRWAVLCAAVQAAVFLPLVVAAWNGSMPVTLVFVLASVYWATGMSCGSAWNPWIETLVPARIRGRYFARRSRIAQWGTILGFLGGGAALSAAVCCDRPLRAFAALFLAAGLSRAVSASLLARQSESMPIRHGPAPASLGSLFRSFSRGTDSRMLIYLLAAQAGVQICGPYFTPFMLGHLSLSYFSYVVLICAASVARIALLPAVGRLMDRWGAARVLWLSGIGIIPLPALWLLSHGLVYLVGVQVYAGGVWAAYELATLMLFFQTVPSEKRVDVLTVFNLANAVAIVVGSTAGGALLVLGGATAQAYAALFAISTLARGAAAVLLVGASQRAADAASPALALVHRGVRRPSGAKRSRRPAAAEVPPAVRS